MSVAMTLRLDDLGVARGLRAVERGAGDLTGLMRRIGTVLETSVSERFERGEGPGGVEWPVSGRAQREGGQTLVDSARLRDSIVSEASSRSVDVGTNVIYAAVHQFGETIKPRTADKLAFRLPDGRFVQVDQVVIPPRPFLGFDARDEADITDTVEAYFEGLWS